MQNLSLDKQLLIFLNEALDNRRLITITFSIISISVLIIGLNSPKSYESSTTMLWNMGHVLNPLLEDTAVTSTEDKQSIAKEIFLSSKNLTMLIEEIGLNYSLEGKKFTEREIEFIKRGLHDSIILLGPKNNNNTLKISYSSTDPEKAFLVVSVISRLFIEERISKRKSDSSVAYNFIDKQVNEYQVKLEKISKSIDEFKSQNIELHIDTTQSVNARVNNFQDKIKDTSQKIREEIIIKNSLTEQLVIEAAKSTAVEEVNIKNERLLTLKDKLDTLRLSYTEGYPDIVQIKEQIENLTRSIGENASNQPGSADTLSSNEDILGSGVKIKSPLYHKLQQQLSTIETTLKTLSARKKNQEKQLAYELDRSGEVLLVFNRLEVLSKDYNVTKANYENLKAKREKARISLSLETEKAGSLYQILDPPVVPLIPEGIRFIHFALGSIVAGVVIPLAVIFGLLLLDPRIRHEDDIEFGDALPVIGVIPNFITGKDLKRQRLVTVQSFMIFSLSLVVWFSLALSRFFEVL